MTEREPPITTHTENLDPSPPSVRDRIGQGARNAVGPVIRSLVRMGVGPNTVTVVGFALVAGSCALILAEWWLAAFFVFVVGSMSDMLDGSVARLSGKATRFGAFLDSTLDRTAEGLVLGSIGVVFARQGNEWALAACFVALTASFLVSYARARAEGLGIDDNRGGLMSRTERLFLIGTGLFFAWIDHFLEVVIYVLAALTVLTVVQRVVHVFRTLRTEEPPSQ
jgi:CDP-diacylglycerol--glycerol-3-phosphate 3-phosphatidyltransferase